MAVIGVFSGYLPVVLAPGSLPDTESTFQPWWGGPHAVDESGRILSRLEIALVQTFGGLITRRSETVENFVLQRMHTHTESLGCLGESSGSSEWALAWRESSDESEGRLHLFDDCLAVLPGSRLEGEEWGRIERTGQRGMWLRLDVIFDGIASITACPHCELRAFKMDHERLGEHLDGFSWSGVYVDASGHIPVEANEMFVRRLLQNHQAILAQARKAERSQQRAAEFRRMSQASAFVMRGDPPAWWPDMFYRGKGFVKPRLSRCDLIARVATHYLERRRLGMAIRVLGAGIGSSLRIEGEGNVDPPAQLLRLMATARGYSGEPEMAAKLLQLAGRHHDAGKMYLRAGLPDRAIEVLSKARARSVTATVDFVRAHFVRGDYAEAARWLESVSPLLYPHNRALCAIVLYGVEATVGPKASVQSAAVRFPRSVDCVVTCFGTWDAALHWFEAAKSVQKARVIDKATRWPHRRESADMSVDEIELAAVQEVADWLAIGA